MDHQHSAHAGTAVENQLLGTCQTSLISLIPLSKTGVEDASSNVVILPRRASVGSTTSTPDVQSGQNHDPSGETVAAF